jgi:sulfopyruvate decarboxylase TPP-binding subunit
VIRADALLAALVDQGVTHVVGRPDNGSRALYERLWAQDRIEVVQVGREGEAFAVAAGIYLGGGRPVVLIQNTGLLEAGDALRGTAYNMAVPLVMLVGYRGYRSLGADGGPVDTAAAFTEPTLRAWDVPYAVLADDADAGGIAGAFAQAAAASRPVAVLVAGEPT